MPQFVEPASKLPKIVKMGFTMDGQQARERNKQALEDWDVKMGLEPSLTMGHDASSTMMHEASFPKNRFRNRLEHTYRDIKTSVHKIIGHANKVACDPSASTTHSARTTTGCQSGSHQSEGTSKPGMREPVTNEARDTPLENVPGQAYGFSSASVSPSGVHKMDFDSFVKIMKLEAGYSEWSRKVFEALIERASCCSDESGHHIARLNMQQIRASASIDQVALFMFCGHSNDLRAWHELQSSILLPEASKTAMPASMTEGGDCTLCAVRQICTQNNMGYRYVFRCVNENTASLHQSKLENAASSLEIAPDVSLEKLLRKFDSTGDAEEFRWPQRAKADLILSLARALYAMPRNTWLPPEWGPEHVFFQSRQHQSEMQVFGFQNPFISTRLSKNRETADTAELTSDRFMLSFALLLIEIQTGKRIPLQRSPSSNQFSYQWTVKIASQSNEDDMTLLVRNVISNCMKFTGLVAHGEGVSEEERTRNVLFHNIVTPLYEEVCSYGRPADERMLFVSRRLQREQTSYPDSTNSNPPNRAPTAPVHPLNGNKQLEPPREKASLCDGNNYNKTPRDPEATDDCQRNSLLEKVIRPLVQDKLGHYKPVDERNPSAEIKHLEDSEAFVMPSVSSDQFKGQLDYQTGLAEDASSQQKARFSEPEGSEIITSVEVASSDVGAEGVAALSDWNERKSTPSNEELSSAASAYLKRMKDMNRVMQISTSEAERSLAWPKRPVRVAIIDSGLQTCAERISSKAEDPYIKSARKQGRIIGERAWVGVNCTDECGHGTRVARQLLEVSPHADLVIAKVTGNMRIPANEVRYISEAIEWAIEMHDVDIISLSLGLMEYDQLLDETIDKLLNLHGSQGLRRRVVFAAASNNGANHQITYPARKTGVICVHASDGFGSRARFSPAPLESTHNFATLGVDIEFKSRDPRMTTYISGTSFATPIAVGLAANIFHFARMNLQLEMNDLNILHSYHGVREIFSRLSTAHDRLDFLTPWRNKNHGGSESENSTLSSIRGVVLASIAVARSQLRGE